MPKPQSYQNHTRRNPAFHFVLMPILILNLGFSVYDTVHRYPAHKYLFHWWIVMSIAFILMALLGRMQATRVQDRIIRLEERLRLASLLPPTSRPTSTNSPPASSSPCASPPTPNSPPSPAAPSPRTSTPGPSSKPSSTGEPTTSASDSAKPETCLSNRKHRFFPLPLQLPLELQLPLPPGTARLQPRV